WISESSISLCWPGRYDYELYNLCTSATDKIGSPLEQYVFSRVLVSIINEAAWAFADGVANAPDINTAMKLGTNYPKGPLEWAEETGYPVCGELLDALNATVVDNGFESPEMLKARV